VNTAKQNAPTGPNSRGTSPLGVVNRSRPNEANIPQPQFTIFAERALALAEIAPVFPLIPNAKRPLLKDEHGVLDATRDKKVIAAWGRREPNANVGIAMGDGLVGLDFDAYKEDFDAARVDAWRLPPTRTVRTPRGGLHCIYRYAGALPCVNEGILAPGVCVKSTGGYLVGAGSVIDGRAYEWDDEAQPIADLPEEIAEIIRAAVAPRCAERPVRTGESFTNANRETSLAKWLPDTLARIAMGATRNDTGFWLGCQLRDDGLSYEDAEAITLDYVAEVATAGDHPYTEREALASLRQAYKRERREPARGAGGARGKARTLHAVSMVSETPGEVDDAALLEGAPDDNGNAQAMVKLYGQQFLYSPAYGWLEWVETHWRRTPEQVVQRCAIDTLLRRRLAAVRAQNEPITKTSSGAHSRVTGCVALFKAYVVEPDVGSFDADPDLLNCQNGALNLRTGELTPHDPSQRFTYCLPVAWDEHADMGPWVEFLTSSLKGGKTLAEYLQLCAGYSLTGHTREEKLFYLHGPARAGKGTTTEALLALLPRPLSVEVDFATFTAKRENDSQNFDLAELKPARLVIASESTRGQSLNAAKIKQLTGGNDVRCAFKHKDMFSYRPQFKVWLVSNWEVKADPDDDAVWGRVQVFTFPTSHLGHEDMTLKTRMKSADNLRGVLRWAVEGAKAWYAAGRLTPPEVVTEATTAHRGAQDLMLLWIEDCCTLDPEKWAPIQALMSSYTEWCRENNTEPRKSRDFAEALVNRFGCAYKREAGTGRRGYAGIAVGASFFQPKPPDRVTKESRVTEGEPASHQDLRPMGEEGVTLCDANSRQVVPREHIANFPDFAVTLRHTPDCVTSPNELPFASHPLEQCPMREDGQRHDFVRNNRGAHYRLCKYCQAIEQNPALGAYQPPAGA
jgi:putative DNA primase/helicase